MALFSDRSSSDSVALFSDRLSLTGRLLIEKVALFSDRSSSGREGGFVL